MKKRRESHLNGLVTFENGIYDTDFYQISQKDCEECERIRKCLKEQRDKIEDHIKFLFMKKDVDLYFITFNFSDESLIRTSTETRKITIRRLLTDLYDYVLNIDYGENTNREHYHCIAALEKGSYETYKNKYGHIKTSILDKYKLGNYDMQPIRKDDVDLKRLSRYITKLTHHSIKVKQSYVSVKKGSDYQIYKQIKSRYKNANRNDLQRLRDQNEDLMNVFEM